jgi:hypothetical protein
MTDVRISTEELERPLPRVVAEAFGVPKDRMREVGAEDSVVMVRVPAFLVEADLRNGEADAKWTVAAHVTPQNGRLVFSALRVFPALRVPKRPLGTSAVDALGVKASGVPAGGIGTAQLRRIPFRRLEREAYGMVEEIHRRHGLEIFQADAPMGRLGVPLPRLRGGRRPGRRPPPTKLVLAGIAALYVDALDRGVRPNEAVAAFLQKKGLKTMTAARVTALLHQARVAAPPLLGRPRKQGVAGGALTAEGKRLLARATGVKWSQIWTPTPTAGGEEMKSPATRRMRKRTKPPKRRAKR